MISDNTLKIVEFFNQRNNISSFFYKDKPIIIYNDHRTILNVLYSLYKLEYLNIKDPVNIISFDLHDDSFDSFKKSEIFDILNVKRFDDINIKDFFGFIEFDISVIDNDWVKVGMELNMIKDYLNIGALYSSNLNKKYIDESGIKHDLIGIRHLDFELSNKANGLLVDESNNKIKNIFNFNGNNFIEPKNKYILDFDLDCFTVQNKTTEIGDIDGVTIPWNERTFQAMYKGFYDDYIMNFMESLILNSEIVTICMEPFHCCSHLDSAILLSYLDKYLFEGKLGISLDYIQK